MSVQFDEQDYNRPNPMQQQSYGAVTNLILKLGLAKEPGQANTVMLIIAVIAIALSIFLVFF